MTSPSTPRPLKKSDLVQELRKRYADDPRFLKNVLIAVDFPVDNGDFSTVADASTTFLTKLNRVDRATCRAAFEALCEDCSISELFKAIRTKLNSTPTYSDFFRDILGSLTENDLPPPSLPLERIEEYAPRGNAGANLDPWQWHRIEIVRQKRGHGGAEPVFLACSEEEHCPVQPLAMCALGELTRTGEAISETNNLIEEIERYVRLSELVAPWLSSTDAKSALPHDKKIVDFNQALCTLHRHVVLLKKKRKYKRPLADSRIGCKSCRWFREYLLLRTHTADHSLPFAEGFLVVYHEIHTKGTEIAGKELSRQLSMLRKEALFREAVKDTIDHGIPLIEELRHHVLPSRHQTLCFLKERLRTGASEFAEDLESALRTLHNQDFYVNAPVFRRAKAR